MARFEVRLSPSAKDDVSGIVEYLAERAPHYAYAFVDGLEARFLSVLRTSPNAGRTIGDDRFLVIGDYIVIYRVREAEGLVIVHMVVHGARQWREILEERGAQHE